MSNSTVALPAGHSTGLETRLGNQGGQAGGTPAHGTFLDLLFQGWAEGSTSVPDSAAGLDLLTGADSEEALEPGSSAATGDAAAETNPGLGPLPAESAMGALARFARRATKHVALPASAWTAEAERKSKEADGSAPAATSTFDPADHAKALRWSLPWSASGASDLSVQTGSGSAPESPQASATRSGTDAAATVGAFEEAALSFPALNVPSREDVASKTPSRVDADPDVGAAGDADSFAELILSAKSTAGKTPRVSPTGVAEPERTTSSTAASQTVAIPGRPAPQFAERQNGTPPASASADAAEPAVRSASASGSEDHAQQSPSGDDTPQFSSPRKKEGSPDDARQAEFRTSAESPATLVPPAQASHSSAPAAAAGPEAAAPQLHSQPATRVTTPQEVEKPAGSSVSTIELQLQSPSSAPLAMRFVARQGQVEIQLKSGDRQTVQTLSENLNGLKAALGEAGWDVTSRGRTISAQSPLPTQAEPLAGTNPAKETLPLPQDSTQRIADGLSGTASDRQPPAQAERVGHSPEVQSGQSGGAGGNENRRDADSGGGSPSGRQHQQDAKQGESAAGGHGQGRQPARDAEAWLDSIEKKLTSSDAVRTYTGVIR